MTDLFTPEQIARYERHVGTGGWIAVDFDATLAVYHKWGAALEFGAPIARMVERIRFWLAMGLEVRIFTARLPESHDDLRYCEVAGVPWNRQIMMDSIYAWTHHHVGRGLTATCVKDLHMIELWDDRAVQVIANTGMTVSESLPPELLSALAPLARIADEYESSRLDEHRPEWDASEHRPPASVVLCEGRGGVTLITLQHALDARAALRKTGVSHR